MDRKIYEKTKYPGIFKHKKNSTYCIDVSLGYDNLTGKRIRTARSGINSLNEAKQILANLTNNEKIKQGLINKLTFNQAFDKYLYYCEYEKKLAFNTIKKRKGFYEQYYNYFNNAPLNKISKQNCLEFQKYLNNLKLANRTKNDIFSVLAMFFNWCVIEDLMMKAPTKGINNFSFENKKMDFYNVDEFNLLITYMDKKYKEENQHITLVASLFCRLIYFLGTRPGETHGIKDKDIDYNKSAISINKSIHFEKGKGNVKSKTKTLSSNRTLITTPKLIDYISQYKNEIKKHFDYIVKKDDYIFFNPYTNKLYNIETIRQEIDKCMKKANVKHIRLHDLRHSHAALLMSQGEELYYIKEDLGHSRYDITVDVYGHLDINKKQQVANSLEKFM